MNLKEYAALDGVAMAALVRKGEILPKELAKVAGQAIAKVNPDINAVIEIYEDNIDRLDERDLGDGPFRGVPFLMKDIGEHLKGRKTEYGSRLCRGLTSAADTFYGSMLRQSGVNFIGRTNTPEYSMASSAENLLYGATHNPWKRGHATGGSTGGGAAAVAAGIVPLAHGSDIG
jgi:Asp-tRNA(Asn)/Glu-tRNA(Gln) amidotransferase A subunit family amidase